MNKVISGFPGIGKSHLVSSEDLIISDSDSSKFPKEGFPENYIEYIKEQIKICDIVLVSSHEEVRRALVDNRINFTLVYPSVCQKQDYLERYRVRGSSPKFIEMMDKSYIDFVVSCHNQKYCDHIILNKGQFLSDVINSM